VADTEVASDKTGNRAGQREGWPSPKDSDAPKPRYQVTGKA